MAASYPSAVKTFSTLVDLVDSALASHQNERGDEITAIENELGVNPSGSQSTVVARLDLMTSGTYTPTLTNTTNIAASTALTTNYIRIFNQVIVYGLVNVDPTAAGACVLGVTLPVSSNITVTADLGGVVNSATSGENGYISGDTTNDRATFSFSVSNTANHTFGFVFGYIVA